MKIEVICLFSFLMIGCATVQKNTPTIRETAQIKSSDSPASNIQRNTTLSVRDISGQKFEVFGSQNFLYDDKTAYSTILFDPKGVATIHEAYTGYDYFFHWEVAGNVLTLTTYSTSENFKDVLNCKVTKSCETIHIRTYQVENRREDDFSFIRTIRKVDGAGKQEIFDTTFNIFRAIK